jgi:hypothetical protein
VHFFVNLLTASYFGGSAAAVSNEWCWYDAECSKLVTRSKTFIVMLSDKFGESTAETSKVSAQFVVV